jgi:glycogen operon protein
LRDLVSYNEKHNEANGEGNQDGESHNRSWNCGIEGETDDADILALRSRQQRNFLTTIILSQGVPMLLHGDEFGRTQGGNNNAYCQDNEISWVDWEAVDEDLLDFTRRLLALRAEHPVFRRRRFFTGKAQDDGLPDIAWLSADATVMDEEDWTHGSVRPLSVFLNGEGITEPGLRGEEIVDDSFLLLLNPSHEDAAITLPDAPLGQKWQLVLDTSSGFVTATDSPVVAATKAHSLVSRSLALFRRA